MAPQQEIFGGSRVCGAPGLTRTADLLVRSQTLYPTELRARAEEDFLTVPDCGACVQPRPPRPAPAHGPGVEWGRALDNTAWVSTRSSFQRPACRRTLTRSRQDFLSTNWLYAALRRAKRTDEAAKALEAIPPEMTNKEPHTRFYLNLVRFFQGRMTEAEALPPEPAAGNTDAEVELPFDTVAYGIGNWHLYNGEPAKAEEYFRRVLKGHVWITWGFIGSETELQKRR